MIGARGPDAKFPLSLSLSLSLRAVGFLRAQYSQLRQCDFHRFQRKLKKEAISNIPEI